MTIYALGEAVPSIATGAYVADAAILIGSVELSKGSSIWPGAILRADNEPIRVGQGSNIQDGAIVHTDPGFPAVIGEGVSVGHGAVLHGCQIGDDSLIGIGAIVLNGAVIGRESLVGAGALVGEGKHFPPRSLLLGVPAKVIRTLTDEELAKIARNAQEYVTRAEHYTTEMKRQSADGERRRPEAGDWYLP